MKLEALLNNVARISVDGPLDREITSIAYDSRKAKPGCVFVAMKGEKVDGAIFIDNAIAAGAEAIVAEHGQAKGRSTIVVVPNAREALADLAANFYQHPAKHLKVAGVTGTNGKTTTAFLLKHVCESILLRCGLLGTVRYEVGERILPAARTTPESLDVQDLLWQMRSAGCKAVAMEVSSHALVQARVRGIEFDAAIFTNLTQDHLDFHGTMDAYFDAKSQLFAGLAAQKKKGKAVINLDDRFGAHLINRFKNEAHIIT
jgi:UDP-N-acetylmuramoyl-L-alanyl-D-glutamate--2,6-diaminopimelate ligase